MVSLRISRASRIGTSFLLGVLLILLFSPPSLADELGIRVQILSDSDPSNRSNSSELWFTGEESETITRTIRVTGLGDIPQLISVTLFDPITENGESSMDFSKPGRYQDWLSTIPEVPVVNPGEILDIQVSLKIPANTPDQGATGALRVFASQAEDSEPETEATGYRAIAKGGAAIQLSYGVGVGAELNLAPQFSIESVGGVLLEGGNFLRIFFRNEGTLPIKLVGSLQLSDAVFADRVFGPYDFRTPEIGASQVGYLDIPAEEGIVEGDYTAYVVAEQLGVRETRLFDVYIEYLPPGTLKFWDIAPWGIAGLFFAVMMVLGIRLIRGSSSQREPRVAPRRRSSRPAAIQMDKVTGLSDFDVDYRSDSRRDLQDSRPSMTRVLDLPPKTWRDESRPAKPVRPRFPFGSKVAVQQPAQEDPLEALRKAVSRISADVENYNATYHSPPRSEIKTQTKTLSQVKTAKPSDPKPRSAGSTTPAKKSPKGTGKAAVSPLNVAKTTVSKTPTKRTPASKAKPKAD